MIRKRPGPTRARNGPIAVAVAVAVMEMQVALMRAGGLSVYRIALALKVRRQSVDHILRRPHVAAMVEDFRERLRAQRLLRDGAQQLLRELLRDGASEWWRGESGGDLFSQQGLSSNGGNCS